MISRVKWDVEACKDATPQQKLRAEYIESIMDDMDGSWFQFIKEVVSYLTSGFAVIEKFRVDADMLTVANTTMDLLA